MGGVTNGAKGDEIAIKISPRKGDLEADAGNLRLLPSPEQYPALKKSIGKCVEPNCTVRFDSVSGMYYFGMAPLPGKMLAGAEMQGRLSEYDRKVIAARLIVILDTLYNATNGTLRHQDCHAGNILVEPDTLRVSLVDWEGVPDTRTFAERLRKDFPGARIQNPGVFVSEYSRSSDGEWPARDLGNLPADEGITIDHLMGYGATMTKEGAMSQRWSFPTKAQVRELRALGKRVGQETAPSMFASLRQRLLSSQQY